MSTSTALRQARLQRGATLEEVAQAVGVTHTTLSRIEAGKQIPRRDVARALFRFYGGQIDIGLIYDPTFGQ